MELKAFEALLSLGCALSLALVSLESVRKFVEIVCLKLLRLDSFIDGVREEYQSRLDAMGIGRLRGDEDKIGVVRRLELEIVERLDKLEQRRGEVVDYCLVEYLTPAFLWAFFSGAVLLGLSALGDMWRGGALLSAGVFACGSVAFLLWCWHKALRDSEIPLLGCALRSLLLVVWWMLFSALLALTYLFGKSFGSGLVETACWWAVELNVLAVGGNFAVLLLLVLGRVSSLRDRIKADEGFIEETLSEVRAISQGLSLDDDESEARFKGRPKRER